MKPRTLQLPAAHGLSLRALEWSDAGEPLLLLHGFGHDAHVWDDVAPALAERFRVVAPDLRGHGDSDRDAEARYGHEAIGLDLEAAAGALGSPAFRVAGHSMGAYGALHWAARHPARVCALALIDAGPALSSAGVSRMRFRRLREEPTFAGPEEYARVLARLHPLADAGRLARLARHGLRARDDGRLVPKLDPAMLKRRRGFDPAKDRDAWAERESAFLWKVLRELRNPTLVVRGAESPVLARETAERMRDEALRRGKLVEIPRAAHAVMLDNPEALAIALADFF